MSLRIFEHFNTSSVCKICETNKDGRAILIPIQGTEDDGIVACEQVHLDCLNLRMIVCGDESFIYQNLPKGKDETDKKN